MYNNLVVYRDPSYTTNWISHNFADAITEVLVQNDFKSCDASELQTWMKRALTENSKSFIVFSQDVMPDLVLNSSDSSALIRRYLDNGGTVLWMGDIPCFNRGRKLIEKVEMFKKKSDLLWYQHTGFVGVLGVFPVICTPSKPVDIKKLGKKLGMSSTWSGIRSIIKDRSIDVIAETKASIATEIISVIDKNILRKFAEKIKKVEGSLSGGGFELKDEGKEKKLSARRTHYKNYPSAWFKHYGGYKNCGFYRIWDFEPIAFGKSNADELVKIVKNIQKRIKL